MGFRAAVGENARWQATGVEDRFSNFLFIDKQYGSAQALRRIFSLARKLEYQSLLIEDVSEQNCDLLAEENAALRLRHADYQGSVVHRLSFFKSREGETPAASDFCGYAIVKRDAIASLPQRGPHVYEAIMRPLRGAENNNYVHCNRTYEVETAAGTYHVPGVLYAQQNDSTFVCAHVALRSALAMLLPAGDVTYSQINTLAGVDHQAHKVGFGTPFGLNTLQIEAVLNGLGIPFQKLVHEPKEEIVLPKEFQADLYGFIESGRPALMGFELDPQPSTTEGEEVAGARHLVPVFGHTFNEDTWLPNARRAYFGGPPRYYPSENWLSSFIMHDDNFGPYFTLPRSFLKQDNFRLMYGLFSSATPLSAPQAEAMGFGYFDAIVTAVPRRGDDWYDRLVVYTKRGFLVLRTMLVDRASYIGHLGLVRDWSGAGLEGEVIGDFASRLPDRFWMVEASTPELFAGNRRKFGEVLLSADRPIEAGVPLLIAARVPGIATFLASAAGALDVKATALLGHTELYGLPLRTDVVPA